MMLGCQDFCGYYDWTFNHVRQKFGQAAIQALWADAIGGESQLHYLRAAQTGGLRGLLETWNKTGEDEHCDWTFSLDEARNVLRWDMRECPSKGYLLKNDLNADEDYCDHCMGWLVPLLEQAGIEVPAHQHNHCGQCWAELRLRGKPYQSLAGGSTDITSDHRWAAGYVDRWSTGVKESTVTATGQTVVTSEEYLAGAGDARPGAVLVVDAPSKSHLDALAARYHATPSDLRPMLLYAYFPADLAAGAPAFLAHHLPRPAPVLPLLIRSGLYRHEPGHPRPTSDALRPLIEKALGRMVPASQDQSPGETGRMS